MGRGPPGWGQQTDKSGQKWGWAYGIDKSKDSGPRHWMKEHQGLVLRIRPEGR